MLQKALAKLLSSLQAGRRDQGGVLLCRGGLPRTGAGNEMRQRHAVRVPPVVFSLQ